MNRTCRIALILLGVAYLAALTLFAIGSLGLFGQERDPLAGVFLVPLGLPWNRFVDVFPEPLWPWLGAATPLLNIAILAFICRKFGAARG